ncbi:protein of unknown function DUF820 [Calothrix sp. PCC 7716]|nr:protein of unknown function DUF820 [Calothrix sp. PCC 7716]
MLSKLHLWTIEDYHRMIDAELLTGEDKVELLEGLIIKTSPQQPLQASTIQRVCDYIWELLRNKADIRVRAPVTLPPNSEPEPDIAVVRINNERYFTTHPTPNDIYWLVEVADQSLDKDCEIKARVYANASIQEYWVVDAKCQQVYVFRKPIKDKYAQQITLDKNAKLCLLAFPNVEIEVKRLFANFQISSP